MIKSRSARPFSLFPLEDRSVPSATAESPDAVKPTENVPALESTATVVTTMTTMAATVSAAESPHAKRFAVGSGAGATGIVNVYDALTNALLTTLTPFGGNYTGGVRVASADFTGDGVDDVAVSTATGLARVVVFDGASGATLADFSPFTNKGTGGAYLSAADVTGDGRADLAIGSGAGQAPEVRVYAGQALHSGITTTPPILQPPILFATAAQPGTEIPTVVTAPTPYHTFTPVGATAAFGVRVAAGDLNGDGKAEVVTASGNSVYSNSLSLQNGRLTPTRRGAVLKTVVVSKAVNFPFAGDTAGVFVAIGDFSGTGRNDIAAGFVANGRARIRVVNGVDFKTMVMDAYNFTPGTDGGVVVTMRDVTGDGRAEVIAASGNGTSVVRVLGGGMGGLTRSFTAFPPNYRGGVFVG